MTNAPEKPTWAELTALLRWFVSLFGDPAELFDTYVVLPAKGHLIRGWLAGLEAMARGLLVTLAASLPPEAAAPRPAGKARRLDPIAPSADEVAPGDDAPDEDVPAGGAADISDSRRWLDVRFAYAPAPPSPARRSARSARQGLMLTRRLAFRLEALIRVAENPERYAARMARRLRRTPKLAYRVLSCPRPPCCASYPSKDVGRALGHAWFDWERAFKPGTG